MNTRAHVRTIRIRQDLLPAGAAISIRGESSGKTRHSETLSKARLSVVAFAISSLPRLLPRETREKFTDTQQLLDPSFSLSLLGPRSSIDRRIGRARRDRSILPNETHPVSPHDPRVSGCFLAVGTRFSLFLPVASPLQPMSSSLLTSEGS